MDEKITVSGFVRQKIMQLDQDTSNSRALCAKLRRAVGKEPGDVPDIWELTLQHSPEEWDSHTDKPSNEEWAVHTALTLYALHRQGKDKSMNREKVSFAHAVGELVRDDENRFDAIQRRFNAVATAVEFTELAHHARGLIQLLKAEDKGMDYPRFAKDLFYYQYPSGANRIRLRWGEDFFHAMNRQKEKDDENE
ncbi:MAG: type I-E CRISPR-associated protein Cse2/CasB [Oscillospiraceae bacterium]|jgi:CRISPR system Cascade subunit CasB|nr:type I-E CRISPR-associated protein Cse2/CasB [Oscillospiraceae bacterium]